jgi:hypothetical protein
MNKFLCPRALECKKFKPDHRTDKTKPPLARFGLSTLQPYNMGIYCKFIVSTLVECDCDRMGEVCKSNCLLCSICSFSYFYSGLMVHVISFIKSSHHHLINTNTTINIILFVYFNFIYILNNVVLFLVLHVLFALIIINSFQFSTRLFSV